VSAVRELKNETTPHFRPVTLNALQDAPGFQGQGSVTGFSSAAARSNFVLDTGRAQGLLGIYQLNSFSGLNAVGAYTAHGSAGIGSSTAGGVAMNVSAALSLGANFTSTPVVFLWSGAFQPRVMSVSSAVTATTVTLSTLVDPAPNTNFSTARLVGDTTSDPLAGYGRYSTPNWDGYGAKAITPETIASAQRFIRDLPKTLGEPDVAPGADGTIGLEWSFKNRPLKKLFIDLGPGSQWSGYWRRATGERRTLPPTAIGAVTKASLQALFDDLNS
jgi:hypothetical protein